MFFPPCEQWLQLAGTTGILLTFLEKRDEVMNYFYIDITVHGLINKNWTHSSMFRNCAPDVNFHWVQRSFIKNVRIICRPGTVILGINTSRQIKPCFVWKKYSRHCFDVATKFFEKPGTIINCNVECNPPASVCATRKFDRGNTLLFLALYGLSRVCGRVFEQHGVQTDMDSHLHVLLPQFDHHPRVCAVLPDVWLCQHMCGF